MQGRLLQELETGQHLGLVRGWCKPEVVLLCTSSWQLCATSRLTVTPSCCDSDFVAGVSIDAKDCEESRSCEKLAGPDGAAILWHMSHFCWL